MSFKNPDEFIEYYVTFLQINAVLYHPKSCAYSEPTTLYPDLIQDLLLYIDLLKEDEKEYIEKSYPTYGTIEHIQHVLLEQLDRLEKPYDLEVPIWQQF